MTLSMSFRAFVLIAAGDFRMGTCSKVTHHFSSCCPLRWCPIQGCGEEGSQGYSHAGLSLHEGARCSHCVPKTGVAKLQDVCMFDFSRFQEILMTFQTHV